jgi:hypothetical protein
MTNYEAFLNWVYTLSPADLQMPREDVISGYRGDLTPDEKAFLKTCTVVELRKALLQAPEDYNLDKEFTAGGAPDDAATNITSPYIVWVYP